MKVTIELNEDDAQEIVELGQQLLEVVDRLEEVAKCLEILQDAK